MSRLPLEGVRILEFGQLLAVPHATKLLADMGAEVIKIESCVRLNGHRNSSFLDNDPGERFWNRAANYNDQNRNKQEITLDLTKPEGREVVQELVKMSDVVCENFASRVMGNFGLDYPSLRKLRPDIIMLSSTGYGHTGPFSSYIAAGGTTEAASGILWISGYPDRQPRLPSIPYTDFVGAQHGAFAVMAALHYRRRTGNGQWIDLAQAQASSSLIGEVLLDYISNGRNQERMGNRHPYMAPHGCYPCMGDDKWVVIAVSTEDEWHGLCQALGNPVWASDPLFTDPISRYQHQDELDLHIAAWTAQLGHYEAMHLLQEWDVPAGAVLTNKELLTDPHYGARSFYQTIEHPAETGIGRRPYPGLAWKMSRTPGSIRGAAPIMGQDNEEILGEILGMSWNEVQHLETIGVIGKEPVGVTSPRVVSLDEQEAAGTITDHELEYKDVLGI